MVHTKEAPSTAELIRQMSEQVSRLIRDELRLAKIELVEKGRRAGIGAGLVGAAGLLATLAAGSFVAMVILLLALVMPAWVAALIVGAVLLIAAGVAGLTGRRQVAQGTPPTPELAMQSVRSDIDVVKERAFR
jgi:uncharacterized membrane protein YqjE